MHQQGASQFLSGILVINAVKGGMNVWSIAPESRPEEVVEPLSVLAARLAVGLESRVRQFVAAAEENLGDIELAVEQQSRELLRQATERAAQQKADGTPPLCPVCQQAL